MPDRNGYPTNDELAKVRKWDIQRRSDCRELLAYVKSIWWMADWGISVEGSEWRLSTGGWSGNEDIIGAMKQNALFWLLTWESSRRGGHYVFKADEDA